MKDTFVIQLDLTMMAEQLHSRIAHRSEEIHGLVNQTIQQYCADGSIDKLVDAEVRMALNESVRDSIDKYFRLGNGRSYIDKQVNDSLDKILK